MTSDLKEGIKFFPADPRWGDGYGKYVEEFREIFSNDRDLVEAVKAEFIQAGGGGINKEAIWYVRRGSGVEQNLRALGYQNFIFVDPP